MTFHATVELTADQLKALRAAREHVRVHMAHDHSWAVRDAAMDAIGKVVAPARSLSPASDRDALATERLVEEMYGLPGYRGWQFSYEYPGLFRYSCPSSRFVVFCTPDWEEDETLPIQVQDRDGDCYDKLGGRLPLPRACRTAQKIFEMLRPVLDELLEQAS
jgi:hypothetical protein